MKTIFSILLCICFINLKAQNFIVLDTSSNKIKSIGRNEGSLILELKNIQPNDSSFIFLGKDWIVKFNKDDSNTLYLANELTKETKKINCSKIKYVYFRKNSMPFEELRSWSSLLLIGTALNIIGISQIANKQEKVGLFLVAVGVASYLIFWQKRKDHPMHRFRFIRIE